MVPVVLLYSSDLWGAVTSQHSALYTRPRLQSHRSRTVATPRTFDTGGQKEDNLGWIFTHLLLHGAGGQVSRRLVHDLCPVSAVRVSSTAGAGPASTLYSRADSCKWPVAVVAIHTSASTEQAASLASIHGH